MNKKKISVVNKQSQSSMAEILKKIYENHPHIISTPDLNNIDKIFHNKDIYEKITRHSRLKEKSNIFEDNEKC